MLETCAGVSVALGPVISAPLYDLIGFQAIFYGGAVVFLVVCPLAFLLRPKSLATLPTHTSISLAVVVSLRVLPT